MSLVSFPVLAPSTIPANGTELIEVFANSSDNNYLYTRLSDGTLLALCGISAGFYAEGTTDGQDFIIQSELVTDEGLTVSFDVDGEPSYLGAYYGAGSEYNSDLGEYIGFNVFGSTKFAILTTGGSLGTVDILPRSTSVQQQIVNIWGGSTFTNQVELRADDDNQNAIVKATCDGAESVLLQSDATAVENAVYFTGANDSKVSSVANLYVRSTGNNLYLESTAGRVYIDSFGALDIVADGLQATLTNNVLIGVTGTFEISTNNVITFYTSNDQSHQASNIFAIVGQHYGITTGSIFSVDCGELRFSPNNPANIYNNNFLHVAFDVASYADDAGAQAGGIAVGEMYFNTTGNYYTKRLV